jgi:hypothetical protein
MNVRVWQSKMARLRMSVAQQRGEPEEQRPAWRSSRGAAKAAAARARIVKYCMVIVVVWVVFEMGELERLIGSVGMIESG